MQRKRIKVKGIVQGVGFRPFVYRLAHGLKLGGFVRNTTNGVDIEIEGEQNNTEQFIKRLVKEKPVAARIDNISKKDLPPQNYKGFIIKESKISKGFTQLSPDIATCPDCLKEFNNKKDRRYKFPFINCTNCGPRYSIILNTPYDRPRTSMHNFKMCSDCAKEYHEISNRRFHAQPDCCSVCGPEFSLYDINGKRIKTNNPISETIKLLKRGKIIGIKGIGGFHIAGDATNCGTVKKLRRLKNRPTKPLAIMVKETHLEKVVHITSKERGIIKSPVAPIMLLRKKPGIICEEVAPKNPYLGVMLPYAPVHYLILEEIPYLIMTSANVQDEPIVVNDFEVKTKLKPLVSFYLTHNREIINRCDDSIGFYLPNYGFSIIRRSRGYVPVPIELPFVVNPSLAVGPYLKNTFTLANKKEAYVSPHIGDLDNFETLEFFNEMVKKYKKWFKIEPELIIHDLHPDYFSTKVAKEMPGKKIAVQHHIAHIVSCLGENMVFDKVIGIAFDGTGFGFDGKIWGSEFFIGDLKEQKRIAHLEYLPLPGGEASIKKPYRIAIAYLYKLFGTIPLYPPLLKGELKGDCAPFNKGGQRGITSLSLRAKGRQNVVAPPFDCTQDRFRVRSKDVETIIRMIDQNYNLAYTSSMGRLFDCVSAMLGITKEITYEAEAAINLEYIAAKNIKDFYPYKLAEKVNEHLCHSDPELVSGEESNKKMKPNVVAPEAPDVVAPFRVRSNNEAVNFIICVSEILQGIINDLKKGIGKDIISAKFHNTVARFSLDIVRNLSKIYGVNTVALSGGVFQNRYLLNLMIRKFEDSGFKVYIHQKLPTNDGCISYGQTIYGNLIT